MIELRHSLDLLVYMVSFNILIYREMNPDFLDSVDILVKLVPHLIYLAETSMTKGIHLLKGFYKAALLEVMRKWILKRFLNLNSHSLSALQF